jgi:hypothetical protein
MEGLTVTVAPELRQEGILCLAVHYSEIHAEQGQYHSWHGPPHVQLQSLEHRGNPNHGKAESSQGQLH